MLIICNHVATKTIMSKKADHLGAWASIVCLAHCMLTPLVSVGILITPALWHGLEWVFGALSLIAVILVHRSGVSRQDSLMLFATSGILITGIILEHYIAGAIYGVMITGFILAGIHIKRLLSSRFFMMRKA